MVAALISRVVAESVHVGIALMLRIIVLSIIILLIVVLLGVVSVLRLILTGERGQAWRWAIGGSWRITRHGRHSDDVTETSVSPVSMEGIIYSMLWARINLCDRVKLKVEGRLCQQSRLCETTTKGLAESRRLWSNNDIGLRELILL